MPAGTQIVDVADRILADIRARKLRPGDPYLNTADAAKRLRVSGSTVHRALQLLAQRGVVTRRQRQGTTVAQVDYQAKLRRVHILVREDHLKTEGFWSEGVLLGLQGSLPGVELQFNFRPQIDEADYIDRLIGEVLRARQAAGFVLIRSTVVTQRLVAAAGIPAVVSGTLQPSITNLPSVDRDQHQIGRLMAEHLLERRCDRYLVLMRERLAAGDHAMLDGALAVFAAAGVGLDRTVIRCLPTDDDAIAASVGEQIAATRGRLGCLCRSEPLARGVAAAAEAAGCGPKRRPALIVADAVSAPTEGPHFPCIESTITPQEWGATLGRVLAATADGRKPEPYRLIIPVRVRQ